MASQPPQRPAPQVIIVKQRTDGCLLSVLITLLVPFWGALAVATVMAFRLTLWAICMSWRATVATCRLSWQATIAAARYARAELWPLARDGSVAFHKRFGVRGWAVAGGGVAAVAVALLLVGLLRH